MSDLNHTQDLMYIVARFRMDLGRVYFPEDRNEGLLALVRSFSKVGQYVSAFLFGLMAATLQTPRHRTLNEYVRHSGNYRQESSVQLLIAYGGQVKGKPISKQRFSNW